MISPARRRIVFNAIKAAILKGNEVEYWAMRMYEQLDAGVLTDEQVAELEALIDAYYNPPEPTESVDDTETEETSTDAESEPENASQDFSGMTKAELLEYCAGHDIEAYESWTKAEIIAAIEGAQNG